MDLRVTRDEYGLPDLEAGDEARWETFCEWLEQCPCPHEDFTLLERALGSAGGMARIQTLLAQLHEDATARHPLLSRVISQPGHGEDRLEAEDLERLRGELDRVCVPSDWRARRWEEQDVSGHRREVPAEEARALVEGFLQDLRELVAAARSVNKPLWLTRTSIAP